MAYQHGSQCQQPARSPTLGPGHLTCHWDPGGFLGFPHAQSIGERSPHLKHKDTSGCAYASSLACVTLKLLFSDSSLVYSPSHLPCLHYTHTPAEAWSLDGEKAHLAGWSSRATALEGLPVVPLTATRGQQSCRFRSRRCICHLNEPCTFKGP